MNGEIVAVGEMNPLQGSTREKRVDGMVGEVGDSNETDSFQSREIRRKLEDGRVGELVAAGQIDVA